MINASSVTLLKKIGPNRENTDSRWPAIIDHIDVGNIKQWIGLWLHIIPTINCTRHCVWRVTYWYLPVSFLFGFGFKLKGFRYPFFIIIYLGIFICLSYWEKKKYLSEVCYWTKQNTYLCVYHNLISSTAW